MTPTHPQDPPRPSRRTVGRARIRLVRRCLILPALAALLVSASVDPAAEAGTAAVDGAAEPASTGVWPLQPRPAVVRGFDPPSCTWCAGHRGVDLAGVILEPVLAVLPGTVTYAGTLAGRGVVVIDHGATRTTYEPVAATVHRGDVVAGGAMIGRLEQVGSHCFPAACLHLGLIRNSDEAYLDPLTILPAAPQPVRLLPLWREPALVAAIRTMVVGWPSAEGVPPP